MNPEEYNKQSKTLIKLNIKIISDLTTNRPRTGHIIQSINSLSKYSRAIDFNETIPTWFSAICKTFGENEPESRSSPVPIKTINC
jgi:hypothetical protein